MPYWDRLTGSTARSGYSPYLSQVFRREAPPTGATNAEDRASRTSAPTRSAGGPFRGIPQNLQPRSAAPSGTPSYSNPYYRPPTPTPMGQIMPQQSPQHTYLGRLMPNQYQATPIFTRTLVGSIIPPQGGGSRPMGGLPFGGDYLRGGSRGPMDSPEIGTGYLNRPLKNYRR